MRLLAKNAWTYIEGTPPRRILDPVTSYAVEGAWFSAAYKAGHWDGRSHFIKYDRSKKIYKFPTGLLTRVTKALDAAKYPYEVEDERVFDSPDAQLQLLDEYGRPTIDLTAHPWDYQGRIVRSALAHGRGLIVMPTGGGKTEVGGSIIKSLLPIAPRIAWLTHRKNLMYQTQRRLQQRLGMHVGLYGDGNKDIQDITVVMVQSAAIAFKEGREDLADYLRTCEGVIGDEIHHLESDQWFENFANMEATWRYGLSATPRMDGPGLSLISMVGDPVATVDLLELIERTVLVIPRIWFVPIKEPQLPKKMDWRSVYKEGVVTCKARNEAIISVAKVFKQEHKSAVTLVMRVGHGELLADMMNFHGVRAAFIKGAVADSERTKIMEKLQDGRLDNVVAVASILGEGADFPWLRALINATGTRGGGNTEDGDTGRSTLQFLGRIIRKAKGKWYADYVDISDFTHDSLRKATLDRVSTLQDQGYTPFIKYWNEYQLGS